MGLLGQSVDADGDVTNYTYGGDNFLTSDPDRWHKPSHDDLHQQRLRRTA